MTTKSGMKKEITKIEKEKEDHEKVTKMEGFKLKDDFFSGWENCEESQPVNGWTWRMGRHGGGDGSDVIYVNLI